MESENFIAESISQITRGLLKAQGMGGLDNEQAEKRAAERGLHQPKLFITPRSKP